jgi:hypothetical protein
MGGLPGACPVHRRRRTATKLLDLIEHLESNMPMILAAQLSYDREQ